MALRQLRGKSAVLHQLQQSGVETIAPTPKLHRLALRLAERVGQSKAYDAQYLALARGERALLDGPTAAWPAPPNPPGWPGSTGSAN